MIKDSVMVSEYNVRFFKLDLHVSMAVFHQVSSSPNQKHFD